MLGGRLVTPALRCALAPWTLSASSAVGGFARLSLARVAALLCMPLPSLTLLMPLRLPPLIHHTARQQPAFLANVNAPAAIAAAPLRLSIAREPLEPLALSFARLRLLEHDTPVAMELLNRNARRPKKVRARPAATHRLTVVC